MTKTLQLLLILYAVMSLVSFCAMGIDKAKAKTGAWRIPEKTLFLFAALGGGIGGVLGMQLFRHKTKHWYFALFFPLFAVLQIALAFALWYYGIQLL